MNTLHRIRPWLAALLVGALAACGGGGRDEILGFDGTPPPTVAPPTVTAVTPTNNAIGVPIANPVITATFSEPMAAITGNASFTVTCAAPCVGPTGTVALDSTKRIATFSLPADATLANSTTYTATVTGAKSLATGLPLASPYVWRFTTVAAPPTVTAVAPVNNTTGVAVNNTVITAAFSEPMAAISGGASFVVTCAAPCVSPTGTVALDPTNRIATLSLAAGTTLASNTAYTATVTAAKSLATGLTLVSPYVWHFTTGVLPDTTRPRVTLTLPATTNPGPTTGVPINTAVSAVFTEEMAPTSITASSFTLTCAAPCSAPSGTVTYAVGSETAVFRPATVLAYSTTYTATITTAAKDLAGNALAGNQAALPAASNYIWTFTTVAAPPVPTPISVLSTHPTANATDFCTTDVVSAVFTVPSGLRLDPATVNTATFTVTAAVGGLQVPVAAQSVVLDAATGKMVLFTPLAPLTAGVVYKATIKSGANGVKDVAVPANTMTADLAWTFTAVDCSAPPPPPPPPDGITVVSTFPLANATDFCTTDAVSANFTVPSGLRMDPLTVDSGTFTLTSGQGSNKVAVPAQSVVLDVPTGRIATFTPLAPLTAGVTYSATVKGGHNGVNDLAVPPNGMASDKRWSFTAINCVAPPPVIPLMSAGSFGAFGGSAGMTSQGLNTVVNGDIGTTAVSTAVTGFHDPVPSCTYTETPLNVGTVNGLIYTAAPPPTAGCPSEGTAVTFAIATQARADALAAYNQLVAMPGGPNPGAGNLANLTLAPGVYTAAAGSFKIEGGNLTLDAQGNANATWVFQMATTLTVGGPGAAFPSSIILSNGAQAKNVFWQVGTAATINAGGGGTMVGTVIAQAGAAISTAGNAAITTVNGRVLSLGASVTMVNTVINVPAP
jgi:hypothetical protein